MRTGILLTIILLLANSVLSQTDSDHFSRKNALKMSPVNFANSEFQISYERYLNNRSSSFSITPSVFLKDSNNESKQGWQVMARYNFFLTHFRKDQGNTFLGVHNYGFYAGLYGQYLDLKEDYQRTHWDNTTNKEIKGNYHKDISAGEGGAVIGLQVDITKRILIDFYIGGGIRQTKTIDTFLDSHESYESYNIFDLEYTGVKPKIGFMVGITF